MDTPPTVQSASAPTIKTPKILFLPGTFDNQNLDHANLINTLKHSFNNTHLVLGLIKSNSFFSFKDLNPIIKPEGVDEIHIFETKPSKSLIESMSIDYVAIVDPQDYKDYDKVIIVNKDVTVKEPDSGLAQETETDVLARRSYLRWNPRERFFDASSSCKRKLKNIKGAVWKGGFSVTIFENAVNRSRKYLQDTFVEWGEKRERILRNWMNSCRSSTSVLIKHLREVWEHA